MDIRPQGDPTARLTLWASSFELARVYLTLGQQLLVYRPLKLPDQVPKKALFRWYFSGFGRYICLASEERSDDILLQKEELK